MTAVAIPDTLDKAAILRTLNLNPNDPTTQALLLVCERYGLDPLLKHMVLIQGRPYVTRDGYLHIAHESGQLDGIEILDEGDEDAHWWARVAIYRKDMSRPFTYKGRYPKQGGNKQYGPEMAIKCAEVAALRRAFNVTGIAAADEQWDAKDPEPIELYDPLEGWPSKEESLEAHNTLRGSLQELDDEQRARVSALGKPWPMNADDFDEVELLLIEIADESPHSTEPGESADFSEEPF